MQRMELNSNKRTVARCVAPIVDKYVKKYIKWNTNYGI